MKPEESLPSLFGIDDAGTPPITDEELTFRPLAPILEIPAGSPIQEPKPKEIIYSPTTN